MQRTEYDDHMDELVLKASKPLDGEPTENCANVGAMLVAFALCDWPDREQALKKLIDFIHMVWTKAETHH